MIREHDVGRAPGRHRIPGPVGALMTLTSTWRYPMPNLERQKRKALTGEDRDRLAAELRRQPQGADMTGQPSDRPGRIVGRVLALIVTGSILLVVGLLVAAALEWLR